ncbi:TonB-dependent receptor [Temperatibacter marinus]|uniref:TonB-dependent receptor n=1 Tax=Temperatibacter marinus TaxID=1456591 RepID=A0AA52H9U6_9PROT|nr:TonB-dependent receptor [Temperatibacter marinus]WND03561.1 TonB-dependent receptor [Temperatibacter marinus]
MTYETKHKENDHKAIFLASLSLLVISTVLPHSQVVAQDDDDDFLLEEIVITATKRAESQQTVPIAVKTMTASMIEKFGASDLKSLENASPSMNFGRAERSNRGEITIRGVGDWARNAGMDARAGVYVDGVYMGRAAGANQALFDVERVEILRGPQGTLFGKNTVSGAINITTTRPVYDETVGTVDVSYGNYGTLDAKARYSMPLSDSAALSITAAYRNSDGYIKNKFTDSTINGDDIFSTRAKVAFSPTEKLDIDLSFDYTTEDKPATNAEALGFITNPTAVFLASVVGITRPTNEVNTPYVVNHDAEEFDRRELWGSSLTANYTFDNDYIFTMIASYRDSETQDLNEEDYLPVHLATSGFAENNQQTTLEARVASPKEEKYDFVAGLYYFNSDVQGAARATVNFTHLGAIDHIALDTDGNTQSYSAFFNGNYRFTDQLELNLGARYTSEDKALLYSSSDPFGAFFVTTTRDVERSESNFSPRVGLNYYVNDSIMVYGNWSVAYKSGGWNADFLNAIAIQKFEFSKEKATNIELGFKSELMNKRMRLNIAAFQTKYDDFQVFQFQQSEGSTTLIFDNAGTVTSKGIETDITYVATENLTLTASVALIDAKFDSFRDAGGIGVHYDGNKLPYAPEFNYYLAADYSFELFGNSATIHLDYAHNDEAYANADNTAANYMPSYGVVNYRGSYFLEDYDIELYAFAQNLLDKSYIRSRNVNFFGIPRAVYGKPATYGVGIKFNF